MLPVPGKLSIWPLDGGGFGIDATFHGVTGHNDAAAHEAMLRARGVRFQLRQELGDAWTLRLGPVPRAAVSVAIEAFLGAPEPPR